MNYLLSYFAILLPLTLLDALWILVLAKNFYANQMGFLFTKSVNLIPILCFYPIYTLGILLLVILPATKSASGLEALWRGALLGLMAYGAYDLTNHATIANWPLTMTLVDIFWGVTVTGLTSLVAYFIISALK
jgi:uncharacterized membrane protein